jgi:hypothetical protein
MARLLIPPRLLAIDILGTVLAALGLAGLFTNVSAILPFMANKDVAGMIAAAGFALMTFAVVKILQYLRAMRALHDQPPDSQ